MVARVLTVKPSHMQRPVGQVARLLMRKRLAVADALAGELDDPDAVHQFRVAIRRARSIEKAYRPYLTDVVTRKLRRRLKAVVDATGAARDTEVQLARLAQRRSDPKPHQRPGFDWLQQRLEERLEAEYAELRATLAERFRLVHKPLRARLKAKRDDPRHSFAEVTAGLLLEASGDFATQCANILADTAEEPLHIARISGKRLRYLLEPLVVVLPDAAEQARQLKVLQDLLGEIHDLQVFGQELAVASEEAGAMRMRQLIELSLTLPQDSAELERARQLDERAGLMSLARELQTRQIDLVEHLRARLRAGHAEELVTSVRGLARDCARAGLLAEPARGLPD
ncbi:CHAD domain-containing protein [Thioalkalivibrio sp.]|uniref:CHAD domain-containing protein n=1 Tax=Thioalkalivibrio sp. TaxID=2093813 RepID=UPI003567D09C